MQANFENSPPPLLLRDVIADREAVIALLERNAPYTPLGGWFSPGVDQSKRTAAMLFSLLNSTPSPGCSTSVVPTFLGSPFCWDLQSCTKTVN